MIPNRFLWLDTEEQLLAEIDLGNIDDTSVAFTRDGKIYTHGTMYHFSITGNISSENIDGVIPLRNLPASVMERVYVTATDETRFQLTQDQVQNGDTVKVNSTGLMYVVINDNALNSEDGYMPYSVGWAASVPWTGVIDPPDFIIKADADKRYYPYSGRGVMTIHSDGRPILTNNASILFNKTDGTSVAGIYMSTNNRLSLGAAVDTHVINRLYVGGEIVLKHTADTSNARNIRWVNTGESVIGSIGFHNVASAFYIDPTSNASPWGGTSGLYITPTNFKYNNKEVALQPWVTENFAKQGWLESTSLNNNLAILPVGLYGQSSSSLATTANGYPIQEAGGLINVGGAYAGSCQIYHSFSTNRLFFRGGGTSSSSAGHTAWKEVASKDDLSTSVSGMVKGVNIVTNILPDANGIIQLNPHVYAATTIRTAKTFLAAPTASNGVATFRTIVEDDLPDIHSLYGVDRSDWNAFDVYNNIKLSLDRCATSDANQPPTQFGYFLGNSVNSTFSWGSNGSYSQLGLCVNGGGVAYRGGTSKGLGWHYLPFAEDIFTQNIVEKREIDFTVGGDADTYYPVIINYIAGKYYSTNIDIYRGYNETAPDTWYTPTHKGGLTLTVNMNCDRYWGGNAGGDYKVTRLNQTYSTMVARIASSTEGMVVYLRGGTANYHVYCRDQGTTISVRVYLTTHTDSANHEFAPITTLDNIYSSVIYQYHWDNITDKPSLITGSGTSGYIAKFTGGTTIGNGPAFGSSTTTYLRNDGAWVNPHTYPTIGSWWSGNSLYVTSNGQTDIGRYLDFHASTAVTSDYSVRLYANNDTKNTVELPSASGTLALTSDIKFNQQTASGIASDIPTAAELGETVYTDKTGNAIITYPGASGHLLQFTLNGGSTRYIQFYTTYNKGLYWRQSQDSTLTGRAWRTFLDSSNWTSYITWSTLPGKPSVVTGTGTANALAKFSAAGTITSGPVLGSATTTFLRNDGTWAVPPGQYSAVSLGMSGDTTASAVSLVSGSSRTLSTITKLISGTYTGSGGQQPPSYVDNGKVKFNMMNTPTAGNTAYKDFILMDTYTGSDVPYVTAIGVSKEATPRAFIMSGPKNNTATSSWGSAELVKVGTTNSNTIYNVNVGINGTNYGIAKFTTGNLPSIYAPTSAGTSGQVLKSSGGIPTWGTLAYSELSGGYVLPTASASTLGGIKVGSGLAISNGVLSVTSAGSVDWSNVTNKPYIPDTGDYVRYDSQVNVVLASTAGSFTGGWSSATGAPGNSTYGTILQVANTNGTPGVNQVWVYQLGNPSGTNDLYIRSRINTGAWLAWSRIAMADELTWGNISGKPTIPSQYVLPQATSSALGGIKIGYPTQGKNYPVQLNSVGQAYVNVPWEAGTSGGSDEAVYVKSTTATSAYYKPLLLHYSDPTSPPTSSNPSSYTGSVEFNYRFYVGLNDGTLYAPKFSGQLNWSDVTNKPSWATGSVGPDEQVRVSQDNSTGNYYKPLILHHSDYTSVPTYANTNGYTGDVEFNHKFYVNPGTGFLYATQFVGKLDWSYIQSPPASMKNPYALTITRSGTEYAYDGSSAISVVIRDPQLKIGNAGVAANVTVNNPYINITSLASLTSATAMCRLIGSGSTTISSDSSGNITISSSSGIDYMDVGQGSEVTSVNLYKRETSGALTLLLSGDILGASASRSGIVTTGAQTFAGQKTFNTFALFPDGAGTAASSDMRFKNNIIDLGPMLDNVLKAPSIIYNWKDNKDRMLGTSAQYWENKVPELIVKADDADQTRLVFYEKYSIILQKALQEEHELREKQKIEYESKLDKLTEEVNQLRNCIKSFMYGN